MKNIVLVSGNRIAPAATGGQVRSVGIARALARAGHSVHIFSTAGRKEDYSRSSLLNGKMAEHSLEARLKESTHLGLTFGVLQSVARRLDYPRIWQYHMLARGRVPAALKRALNEADIVLSDLPYCPPIPGPWRSKPWYLISHNLEHKLLEQGSKRQQQFSGWMRNVEGAAPQTYTDIFACAEEDQAFFRDHDRKSQLRLPLVRCGVDPSLYAHTLDMRVQTRALLGLADDERVLVFSGSGFGPNVEAFRDLQAFCRTEAEFLAAHRVRFLVVGSVCREPTRDGALITTGPVPEILPYFAASDAGLNLVARGSGSNVKLFEYLAAKLPVISTTFGVRGTELQPVEDYLPCSRGELKEAVQRFIAHDREFWRVKAEDVWRRHAHTVNIQDLVNSAISVLPHFGN